jgi:hypothetical protein
LSTHQSLLQCVCGRLDFHEPTPSSPCHNLRNHFFGIFLCLFIYLFFKTTFSPFDFFGQLSYLRLCLYRVRLLL